jgi:hypothetical protein
MPGQERRQSFVHESRICDAGACPSRAREELLVYGGADPDASHATTIPSICHIVATGRMNGIAPSLPDHRVGHEVIVEACSGYIRSEGMPWYTRPGGIPFGSRVVPASTR